MYIVNLRHGGENALKSFRAENMAENKKNLTKKY